MTGGWLPPERTSPTVAGTTPAADVADADAGADVGLGLHDEPDPFPPGSRRRHAADRRERSARDATAAGSLGLPVALVVAAVGVGLLVLLLGGRGGADDGLLLAATGGPAPPSTAQTGPAGTPVAAGGPPADAGPVATAPAPGAAPAQVVAPAQPSAPQQATGVTVHVVGAVLAPGLVELPAGARVADALEAAGGAAADADLARVNLARPLLDGEQVLVPVPGEVLEGAPAAAPAGGGAGRPAAAGVPAAGGPVDLNTAGVEELDTLPGVGPVLAQRIVDWRTDVGPFASVADLTAVSGIGEALVAGLEGVATV